MATQESKEVYVNEIVAESAIGYCFSAVHLVKELAKRLLPLRRPDQLELDYFLTALKLLRKTSRNRDK